MDRPGTPTEMASRPPSNEMLHVAESLFGPLPDSDCYPKFEQTLRELLPQIDHDDLHQVHPVSSWGAKTQALVAQQNAQWSDLRLLGFSVLGLVLVRLRLQYMMLMAEIEPLDLTRHAMVLEYPNGRRASITGTAYLVAMANDQLTQRWQDLMRKFPAMRPGVDWDATQDLRAARELKPCLKTVTDDAVSVCYVLQAAASVDTDFLASMVEPRAGHNRLVDAVTELHVRSRLGSNLDLLHLLLKPGVDITPGPRQRSLLHLYAQEDKVDACMKLLSHGHPLECLDDIGRTPQAVAQQYLCASTQELLRVWKIRQSALAALRDIGIEDDVEQRAGRNQL